MLTDYLDLLDIDHGDAVLEGLPSIVALNALASRPPPGAGGPGAQVQPGTAAGHDPTQQGDQAGQTAPVAQQHEPGPQPYPHGPPGLPSAVGLTHTPRNSTHTHRA